MMTGLRFQQLQAGATPTSEEERAEYLRHVAWKRGSEAAFRAVATKRRKYPRWPSRATSKMKGVAGKSCG